jgi:hypothetical protein
MTRRRYLTKSRYKIAQECPTKLYYADHPELYENKNFDNEFLKALAHGGFQVGALAHLYFPNGTEVTDQDHDKSLKRTKELLAQDCAVIYEAAFLYNNLFVRADIVVKNGKKIEIIEVKAKSFDPSEDEFFDKRLLKKGLHKIGTKWKPYLYDIAFQTYVCQNAYPKFEFKPFLMLADKSTTASVDGLNQKFLLVEDKGRTRIKLAEGTSLESLGDKILCKVDVSHAVQLIHQGTDLGDKSRADLGMKSFEDEIQFFASFHERGDKIPPEPGSKCKGCEFRSSHESPQKSGFKECWAEKLPAKDIDGPFVFDIWNFRNSEALLSDKRPLMRQVKKNDIKPENDNKPGISASERQWIQVELTQKGTNKPYVDHDGLRLEIRSWQFPYHFIDFETTMAALPFNAGRRPYEQVAFQFSHHVAHSDGRIEHAGQYINEKRGEFPNFDFLRALKSELEKDSGTIFRYSSHENTVLNQIYEQLGRSKEKDREELRAWIKTITRSSSSSDEEWAGPRQMVDMWEVLKRFYYHPLTNGSNSIKKVLPAILAESKLLQAKYGQPVYGTPTGIRSLNYSNCVWLKKDEGGQVIDPYKQLPKIFDGVELDKLDFTLMSGDELADGGAAMTAYAKMQFSEMSPEERTALKNALLKYCELDTLAMVMLYEHWAEITGVLSGKRAA